jgi:type VI secretion system secreted protein VgrG
MRSRWVVGPALGVLGGLALVGCSKDDNLGAAPTLPAIATTTPVTTAVVVATTLPKYYEVQSGDTLFAIAAAYAIPVQALLEVNPEVSSPDDIQAGQFLVIPPREGLVADQLPPTVPGQTAPTLPTPSTVAPTSTP